MNPADVRDVEAALCRALAKHLSSPQVALAGPPLRLYGGNQSWVWSFALRDAPPPFDRPLVLRIPRPNVDPAGFQREACLHLVLRGAGFPVPAILLHASGGEPFDRPYQIMPRLEGRPMVLGDLDSEDMLRLRTLWIALKDLRQTVFGGWPEQLAALHHRLHQLDRGRLAEGLSGGGVDPALLSLLRVVERLQADIGELRLTGIAPALDWVRSRIPDAADLRLCHGDFFPNQVFVRGSAVEGVIDWSEAVFAPVELEVGIVVAGLSTLPAPAGPPMRALMRRFAGRYQREYEALHALDADQLRWAEAYRCTHLLVSVAHNRAARAGSTKYHEIPQPYDNATGVQLLVEHLRQKTGLGVAFDA